LSEATHTASVFSGRKRQALLLLAGVALLALSQVRFGVGLLGWFAPVPFLVFLGVTRGWRSRLALLGALCLAWTLAAAKYITPPFPYVLILLNGVSFGVVNGAGYLLWDRLRRGLPSHLANPAFAAVLVVLEWLQFSFTPLASNGAAAYTQLENLAFLQSTSLFGITGPSLLMYWFAAVAAHGVVARRVAWKQVAAVVGLIAIAHVWGAFRIGAPSPGETVTAAAVGTDSTWFGEELPDGAERGRIEDALFARTRDAAAAGARLIVWNEVSNIVDLEHEFDLIERAGAIAREHRVHLVMAYLVPIEHDPLRFENKYTWVGPTGEVLDTYYKQKPVPGEPSVPKGGAPKVIETDLGAMTGAICFDFDFPQVGRDRASRGADVVFLPSSDSVGVDPFHTQIAAVRAIEGGYSLVRSTRMGLSAGIDPQGRIRGWLSSNETDRRVLLVEIPKRGVWTLYSAVGDLPAYLAAAYILFLVVWRIRSRARSAAE
jgi:apolipoprotein N-acyltransferase